MALASHAYMFVGNATTFSALPNVNGSSTVKQLYKNCAMYQQSGAEVSREAECVTTLFSYLLIGLGVAPSGTSVAVARPGFGEVTISDETVSRYLPTNYNYFMFEGDANIAGLKMQSQEKNGTTTAAFVQDLEFFAREFTGAEKSDSTFSQSDSWRYSICDLAGEVLLYGLIVAELDGFTLAPEIVNSSALDVQHLGMPPNQTAVASNYTFAPSVAAAGSSSDNEGSVTAIAAPSPTTIPPEQSVGPCQPNLE